MDGHFYGMDRTKEKIGFETFKSIARHYTLLVPARCPSSGGFSATTTAASHSSGEEPHLLF